MEKTVTLITEPTRQSKKFEDNVTVIRIFNPDKEKMIHALKLVIDMDKPNGSEFIDNKNLKNPALD